jgi:hypothetical protein
MVFEMGAADALEVFGADGLREVEADDRHRRHRRRVDLEGLGTRAEAVN